VRVTVAAVRSQALDLLSALSHADAPHEAVARLQRVANDLGRVFAALPADAAGPVDDPLDGLDPPPSRHAAGAITLGYLTIAPEAPAADQAERWLRILRLHGRAGQALQRLGIRELPPATVAEPPKSTSSRLAPGSAQWTVIESAAGLARTAGAPTTDTVHVLFAVRAVFGSSLDRALYGHGVTWEQVTTQLVDEPALAR
jgi:hypothetical protein